MAGCTDSVYIEKKENSWDYIAISSVDSDESILFNESPSTKGLKNP